MLEISINQKSERKKEILKIIYFFDLFDFPLSFLELRKMLNQEMEALNDLKILDELIDFKKIDSLNGFYFLRNRQEILEVRRERYNHSLRKIKIAKKFANVFSKLPFVLTVYLANSIGKYNLRDGSDIDFFIITKDKRIWLSRLFCAGIAKILNKRPNKKTKRDKICLSFYLSENNLDLSPLKMNFDPYFDFWEKNLILLTDKNNCHAKFLKQNLISRGNLKKTVLEGVNKNRVLDSLEFWSMNFQLKIMPEKLLLASLDQDFGGVLIKNDIIKLYLKDRRLEIREKYEQKIREFI